MKTRKQCFEEARQLFIDSNPELVSRIESEAVIHADALGLSHQKFVQVEIDKQFGRYVQSLGDNGHVKIIGMMSPDEATKQALVLEYYYEEADALGIPRDEFLRANGVQF